MKKRIAWNKGLTKYDDERVMSISKNVSKTRKKQFETGEIEHWAKGLTKENDGRIKNMSNSLIALYQEKEVWSKGQTKETSEGIRKRSETLKKKYENGYESKLKGRVGPTKGMKHSIESRQLMSQQRKGRIPWNKGLTIEDDRVKKYSETRKEGYRTGRTKSWNKGQTKNTDSRIMKSSETMKTKIIETDYFPKTCHPPKFIEDLGHNTRSSWETNICRYLKFMNVDYEYEKHRFKIKLENTFSTYTPDIYIKDYDLFLEIKGYRGKDDGNLLKYNLFREQYPQYKIVLIDGKKYKEIINNRIFYTDFTLFLEQHLN